MKDKWYALNLFIIGILILIDARLTRIGLNNGLSEGNPLIVWGFETIGVNPIFIITLLLSFIALCSLYWVREKIDHENIVRFMYVSTSILIMIRAYVIGQWVGILNYVLY